MAAFFLASQGRVWPLVPGRSQAGVLDLGQGLLVILETAAPSPDFPRTAGTEALPLGRQGPSNETELTHEAQTAAFSVIPLSHCSAQIGKRSLSIF